MLWPVARSPSPSKRWRARSGADVARWIDAVGELEALGALAGYAYEHPDDPFPEIVDERAALRRPRGSAIRSSRRDRCVRNDVRLGGELRLLVVSGSNMSGKSTLLRTVGINVGARAGRRAGARAAAARLAARSSAPPCASRTRSQRARSRFYAEITRLRQLVDLPRGRRRCSSCSTSSSHGTNSHDRRIGAEAVVRGLVDRGAIGLVTTHDLALAEIADALAPRAAQRPLRGPHRSTASCASTTACGPASSSTATRSR